MIERFHLFVRQHANDWLTASVLTHPDYAAFGPSIGPLREELAAVLADELAAGAIAPGEHFFPELRRRTLTLDLKAVQHDRLIHVPMRFTLLWRPLSETDDLFEVRIPRIGETFRILGEDNVEPWAEEVLRGRFHLASVETLLGYLHERGERVEPLDVTWSRGQSRVSRKRRERDTHLDLEPPDATPLATVGTNLVAAARDGRLPRAHFRDAELRQLASILAGGSALLVGASGVGKTALVHELAHRVARGLVPGALEDAPLWHVTGGRIIAGMKYLGQWQARCLAVIEEIRRERGILFVDHLLELVSAGHGEDGLGVAQMLLPPVASGELTVVAEATPDALLLAEQKAPAFVRALRRLPVPPLDAERAYEVLALSAAALEKPNKVQFTPPALSRALDLIARFGDADALPGAGLALIEQMARLPGGRRTLHPADAVTAFSRASGFSRVLVDPEERLDPDAVRAWFEARLIGQPDATERLADLVLLLKSGLNDPDRPLGSFLFMGPTGVGKTESALTLAEHLFGDRDRLVRFDMSEYGYPGSATRLVDGPRGEGDLTRRVREQPFCVLLLDEIEKADPEVFDVLLQVLGEGRLTDATGRTVRFRHAIVVMTSNLGAGADRRPGLVRGPDVPAADHYRQAARAFFRPELVNRIDFLVPFRPLDRKALRDIARRMLDDALGREGFARRGLAVTYDDSVLDLLLSHGHDPRYGARPMKRAIEQHVLVPLSRRLVRGEAARRLALTARDGAVLADAP